MTPRKSKRQQNSVVTKKKSIASKKKSAVVIKKTVVKDVDEVEKIVEKVIELMNRSPSKNLKQSDSHLNEVNSYKAKDEISELLTNSAATETNLVHNIYQIMKKYQIPKWITRAVVLSAMVHSGAIFLLDKKAEKAENQSNCKLLSRENKTDKLQTLLIRPVLRANNSSFNKKYENYINNQRNQIPILKNDGLEVFELDDV